MDIPPGKRPITGSAAPNGIPFARANNNPRNAQRHPADRQRRPEAAERFG